MSSGVVAMTTRLGWIAGRDQVAHAQHPRLARTLCGCPAVVERLAWPARASCARCLVLAGELAGTTP